MTGLDPAPTTAMWLFVQPTCPQLNTDSDRGRMATSLAGIKRECEFPWKEDDCCVATLKDKIKPVTGKEGSDRF